MTRITKAMVKEVLEGVCPGSKSAEWVDMTYENINKAIAIRAKKNYPSGGSIIGAHPLKDGMTVIFSNDPWDIFRMSAGNISKMSCMRPGGAYERGIYDDIAKKSIIAIIKRYGDPVLASPNWHARVLLRWCTPVGKKKKQLGIEAKYYSPFADRPVEVNSNILIAPGLTAYSVTGSIKQILRKARLIDYDVCVTEERYIGYSDVAGASDTRIGYHP